MGATAGWSKKEEAQERVRVGSLLQNSFLMVRVTPDETDPFRTAVSPQNKFMAAVPLKIYKNEIICHMLMI